MRYNPRVKIEIVRLYSTCESNARETRRLLCQKGKNYRTRLETHFLPFVNIQFEEMVFQQDGAPAHYARVVCNLLNKELDGRWIERRGSIEWPARSPGLTPLDFFFGVS